MSWGRAAGCLPAGLQVWHCQGIQLVCKVCLRAVRLVLGREFPQRFAASLHEGHELQHLAVALARLLHLPLSGCQAVLGCCQHRNDWAYPN